MKLNFELVPSGTWYKNLRSILSDEEWDIVRKDAYEKADGKCMICGKNSSRLDAHETWSYDEETHIQKLVAVRAVCTDCHRTIHVGRAGINGELAEALNNYCNVNNCSKEVCAQDYNSAFMEWERRSNIKDWKLDICWLEQNGFIFKRKVCKTCNKELFIDKIPGNKVYKCTDCGYTEPILCNICNKPMIVRNGKNGIFIGCTGFPNCKNTKNLR